ncbi:FtsX-like permease family protein [Patescibacteria group bacterium]|nr:FtsX-like permease family protein [Patescibacteria group bacterium]
MKNVSAALTNIRRSPYQTLAVMLLVSITFFVGYVFSLFLYSTEQILRYFETRPQITAFFNIDSDPVVIEQLQRTMESKSYVSNVTVISKERALEIYQEDNKKDPLLLELVTADILPASIEVSGKDATDLPRIKEDLEGASGIDEVVYQQDVIEQLQSWTKSIRYIGIGSVVVLGLTSLLLIIIVTGLKVVSKRRTIQIMRIIGASSWYVKAPFIYEGMIYGLFGSAIGWGSMYLGLLYATPWLQNFLGSVPLFPLPLQFYAIQAGIGTLIGLLLGALASSFATSRMMRHA